MALGGDIGGLYGAIVALPGLVLSFYTVRMFHKSVSADLPVKDAKDSQMPKSLDEKLSSQSSSALTSKDVESLTEEATSLKRKSQSWVDSMRCCSKKKTK